MELYSTCVFESGFFLASLVAQRLKHLPAMWETWVRSLDWEDPLEKEMATHSSILAWRIPWMEEPGGLQSTGSQESDTTERLHFLSGSIMHLTSVQGVSLCVVSGIALHGYNGVAFIPSSIDRQLGCLQFLATVNDIVKKFLSETVYSFYL